MSELNCVLLIMSIPEIAIQIVNDSQSNSSNDTNRTIFLVGSKAVGKSTVLYSFLDKNDNPHETLVLEYSFGRKPHQKQGIEKTVCHVWEYGGKLDILKTVLSAIPVKGNFYYCIMIDLSKIKTIWNTLETCIEAVQNGYVSQALPELVLLGGQYDLFKNYDSDIKKFICTTLRSVALLLNAHLLFYSSKEPQLIRRAKELFHGVGFGNGLPNKDKNTNFNKPLNIPKDTDSWDSIGIAKCTFEQIKSRHLSRISSASNILSEADSVALVKSYPEPTLDSLISLKYEELRNSEVTNISINDYLLEII